MTSLEILKLIIPPFAAVLFAGLIGNWLSARWHIWQKQRESSLIAVAEFTRLYGEFFSIWKLWNYTFTTCVELPPAVPWQLLQRAAAAEAGIEALFVRLASLKRLSAADVEIAGKFRQAYQQLRERIRDNNELDWSTHDHPQYVAFKILAASFARLLTAADRDAPPTPTEASEALLAITSNVWEASWTKPIRSSRK